MVCVLKCAIPMQIEQPEWNMNTQQDSWLYIVRPKSLQNGAGRWSFPIATVGWNIQRQASILYPFLHESQRVKVVRGNRTFVWDGDRCGFESNRHRAMTCQSTQWGTINDMPISIVAWRVRVAPYRNGNQLERGMFPKGNRGNVMQSVAANESVLVRFRDEMELWESIFGCSSFGSNRVSTKALMLAA